MVEQCGGTVEQWNSDGGRVWWKSVVEGCGATVWWNSVVEQWNSVVEQWNSDGGTVLVEQ